MRILTIMEDPVVELQSGFIRGIVEKHEDGFDYYAFKGIPYAEPPIGELRFEDPIPKKSWTGVLDCNDYGPICLQHNCFFGIDSYDEDCLNLSIFTQSINREYANIPVIFVIHGGAFTIGSCNDFVHGPEYLIRKNVVLVMINYRLGVLGFLNLDDEIAPGNQALRDLLLGLQWVQQNIRKFSGDPNNVTVLGLSSGGVMAHYLALSPFTKGLIHKVIAQGGMIYSIWSLTKNMKLNAIQLCSLLGKNLTDSAEILQFLKKVDAVKLHDAQESLRQSLVHSHTFGFGPGRDDKSPNPFMPMDPITAANQGTHIPFIVGCNSHEGILLLRGMTRQQFFEMCDLDFRSAFLYNMSEILYRYNLTTNDIRRFYYGDEKVSEENMDKFVKCLTDLTYLENIHRFVRVQVENSSASTYLFLFNYEASISVSKILLQNIPSGDGHFDDLPYIFKMHVFEDVGVEYFKKGSRDFQLMEQMTEMWTNFAKYGRPTIETSDLIPVHWTPVNDGTVIRYLNIDQDLTMQSTINTSQKLMAIKSGGSS